MKHSKQIYKSCFLYQVSWNFRWVLKDGGMPQIGVAGREVVTIGGLSKMMVIMIVN